MSEWEILNLENSKEWLSLVESCEQPDLHFLPEYMKLYEEKIQGKALLFISKDQDTKNLVVYPFFLRDIRKITIFSELKEEVFDIISPWYYGGPLLKNVYKKNQTLKKFLIDFQEYVKKNNIISEFTRIHPILDKNQEFSSIVKATPQDLISYINLNQSLETIWDNFKKSNRNSINAAIRNNIQIKFSKSYETLRVFTNFYHETMKRLNVNAWYFFSFDFFKNITNSLNNNFIVATAIHQNKIISSALFFYKYGISYYWLSGYDNMKRNLFPNNLLLFESIKWLKEKGNHCFILGGGNANLNKFKQSFTNTTTKKFHFNKIHDLAYYEKLLGMYKIKEIRDNNGFFFVIYWNMN